ncbi:response regulator transcription factor [Ruminococcus flavefaciens]|uniref:response regulator transcription factor n=1 Tax=Ruminococcus flavefaciens TaxID=1265 RepID=UPI0026F20668|nr:response regulator transcription factor [Ruminococcus flavefaciens]MDD7516611.1 response regulator transcription factor [Ruminococcus flavefaciens]MDY5692442.1 response regulator transcription factor [Ruminococcus flavefaciens]
MFSILVVEDDKELCGLFCRTLIKNGYNAIPSQNASEALDVLEKEYIDLMISDVMMPGMNGFELVKAMRVGRMDMPVLMITAKGDINDKEQGFKSGADDYMVKPIDLKEMLFRVAALLRRAKSASERKLTFGETLLEYDTQTVSDANGSQILPLKEFQLLYKLLSYPGQIFTRQQILDDIWGFDDVADSHTLDVHISRLRERFKKNTDFRIVTIRGLGYRAVKYES